MSNKNLHKANKAKNDEFYTQLSDIERELQHYEEHFEGKTIFCNCDDPEKWVEGEPFEGSNFWNYFWYGFKHLGLKKLISTHYETNAKSTFKYECKTGNSAYPTPIEGNGDFRSEECIELLKEADIVVTNPPFSLFREFVDQLIQYGKKFIIIGNMNAITYKETFKLIKENKIWLGCSNPKVFLQPDGSEKTFGNICWFTNLTHKKRNEELILYRTYKDNEGEYPKYDNYDAINVDKTKDIPIDYEGIMGVPISFLDKYNPKQFEIIGLGISNSGLEIGVKPYKEEHKKYRKEVQKRGAVDGDLYMIKNGEVHVPYARILIKNRNPQKGVN